MVCSRRAPGSQFTVDTLRQEHPSSLTQGTGPEDSHQNAASCIDSALPCCTLVTATEPLLLQCSTPLQKWRSTTIFHWVPLGNRRGWGAGGWSGGKKEAEDIHQLFLIDCSNKLAPRQRDPASCLHMPALSCASGTSKWRLRFKRGLHSRGQVPGWRGGLDWRNRRSCRTAGLFYKDSTGAQQLAHCLVWLHVWVVFCWGFFAFALSL